MTKTISVAELKSRIDEGSVTVIDVRDPDEFKEGHITQSISIPLGILPSKLESLAGKKLVMVCRTGKRSGEACTVASHCDVCSLEGGLPAWQDAGGDMVTGGGPRISVFRQVQIIVGALIAVMVVLGANGVAGILGAALAFAGLTGWCGLAMLLGRMPWNQAKSTGACSVEGKAGGCCG